MGIEYRFAALEFRDAGAAIEGVAMPYGTEARIGSMFTERVAAGAFGNIGDVVLNKMHLTVTIPIARTGGGGLTLTDSTDRLSLHATIPAYRADIRDMVARGILRGFSVEMEVKAEDWPAPNRRVIRAAVLHGVGLVDRAAYGEATAKIAERMKQCRTDRWPLAL